MADRTYDAGAVGQYDGTLQNVSLTALLSTPRIECFGFAAITQLFSQVLGVESEHVTRTRLESPTTTDFKTTQIKLLGSDKWRGVRWPRHVFAWFGEGPDTNFAVWRAFDGLFLVDPSDPHFLTNRSNTTYEAELVEWMPAPLWWGQFGDGVSDFH